MPNYDEEKIDLFIKCKKEIANAFGKENKPTDTLITKIMLWVFANVPAFDKYFKKGLWVWSFNKESLKKIKDFYDKNKNDFDSFKIYTLDFSTGKETE